MRDLLRILSLPPALIALIVTYPTIAIAEPKSPYDVPAHMKYFPEDEVLVKKGLAAMEQIATKSPIGARKMTEDEAEMFFLDYWQFDEEDVPIRRRSLELEYLNQTMGDGLLAPLLLHSASSGQSHISNRMNYLFKRDFQCPAGTNSCESIQRPNSCCSTDETCVSVTDTGQGDVGCCPSGQSCTNAVSSCDTSAGYTSCEGTSANGGCCIPGFVCFGVGCAINTTSTTTTTAIVATVTSCPTNYASCPASLGGGCCSSGAACGSGNSCLLTSTTTTSSSSQTTTTTTASLNPPVLVTTGTSNTATETTPRTTTVGTNLVAVCPTNYYFCSAYYRPGCCRIDRNCALSSCPAAESSSAFISNGVTIEVPEGITTGGQSYTITELSTGTGDTGPTTTLRNGACEAGWASCAQSVGGGCCPPNFGCGTSCSATAGGATGLVAKVAPSAGMRIGVGFYEVGLMGLCLVIGFWIQ